MDRCEERKAYTIQYIKYLFLLYFLLDSIEIEREKDKKENERFYWRNSELEDLYWLLSNAIIGGVIEIIVKLAPNKHTDSFCTCESV